MLKRLLPFLLIVGLLIGLPTFAHAEVLNPLNGKAWTLYVFGNGEVIYNILNAVRLLMIPDAGATGFNGLLMFLATVGFLVLAVQAGFDPGKNLMKMFSYILTVSAVHIMTMQMTANIRVYDPVTNYDNIAEGVPALVGVPASIVSEVGQYFTKTVENYYTIPSELTVSGGSFNLFGRMMNETNEFVISNPELKKSLSAYTADCVVPAMARGSLTASELMTSPLMIDTLEKAKHNAIMTKYWPVGAPSTSGTGIDYPTSISDGGESYPVEGGLGAVIPCAAAWGQLKPALERHADDLMVATAQAWSKTGVLVPFEAGMSAAMAMASNGGANAFANYSKPQGYILQQAFLNSMSGNFRTAAASVGNNDILMSAAIAQAEQSQKTSWYTAARVFSNMMGYVYTTLQAFIFAIVPIVIVALMVPGLGKSIFTNYAQILVWLTLWQPMLSIVNYLVTLFGKAQIASTLQLANGVTMQNKYTLTENTNDLMLAAQFLGTMVPLLTWGLVKGSLAFTEFISHGIGSSVAQQAGATAATGNMSMGNLSMDNTSMNKFNTASSSAVGAQSTMGYTGAMQSTNDKGGHVSQSYGAAETRTVSQGLTLQQQQSLRDGASLSESNSHNLQATHQMMADNRLTKGSSQVSSALLQSMDAAQASYNRALSSGNQQSIEAARQAMVESSNAASTYIDAQMKAGIKASFDSEKALAGRVISNITGGSASMYGEVSAGAGAQAQAAHADRAAAIEAWKNGKTWGQNTGVSEGGSHNDAATTTVSSQNTTSRDQSWSESDQVAVSEAIARAASKNHEAASVMSMTAEQGERTQRNVAYRDSDDQALSSVESNIHGQASAFQRGVASQAGNPLTGTPDAAFNQLGGAAQGAIRSNAANSAPGMLAGHRVSSGMPAMPNGGISPSGVSVGARVAAGQSAANAATAAPSGAIAGKEAQLAARHDEISRNGPVGTALNRIGTSLERVSGLPNADIKLPTQK